MIFLLHFYDRKIININTFLNETFNGTQFQNFILYWINSWLNHNYIRILWKDNSNTISIYKNNTVYMKKID